MKTLDEVITALEYCTGFDFVRCQDCPGYSEPDCGVQTDALNYLKEYRDRKETLRNWTEKAISEQQNLSDAITFMQAYRDDKDDLTALRAYWKEQNENNALTWDELRTMEGKPVWVEEIGRKYSTPHWAIHHGIMDGYDGDENLYLEPFEVLTKFTLGKTWKAYRKERDER